MDVYMYTVIDSSGELNFKFADGTSDPGRESDTYLFHDENQMILEAYEHYCICYDDLLEHDEFDEDEQKKISFKEFKEIYPHNVVIDCYDFHMQFEFSAKQF